MGPAVPRGPPAHPPARRGLLGALPRGPQGIRPPGRRPGALGPSARAGDLDPLPTAAGEEHPGRARTVRDGPENASLAGTLRPRRGARSGGGAPRREGIHRLRRVLRLLQLLPRGGGTPPGRPLLPPGDRAAPPRDRPAARGGLRALGRAAAVPGRGNGAVRDGRPPRCRPRRRLRRSRGPGPAHAVGGSGGDARAHAPPLPGAARARLRGGRAHGRPRHRLDPPRSSRSLSPQLAQRRPRGVELVSLAGGRPGVHGPGGGRIGAAPGRGRGPPPRRRRLLRGGRPAAGGGAPRHRVLPARPKAAAGAQALRPRDPRSLVSPWSQRPLHRPRRRRGLRDRFGRGLPPGSGRHLRPRRARAEATRFLLRHFCPCTTIWPAGKGRSLWAFPRPFSRAFPSPASACGMARTRAA